MDDNTAALAWLLCCYFCVGICVLWVYYMILWRTIVQKVSPTRFMDVLSTEDRKIVFYSRSYSRHVYHSSVGGMKICTVSTEPLVFPENHKVIPCESLFERLFFSSYKPME